MSLYAESGFARCIRKIGKGKPIILYGAGMDAIWAIEKYRELISCDFYGCVCDGDSCKQSMKIAGIEILSFDKSLEKYPDAYIWVTAKEYKFEIIGFLLYERGICAERILNYEPVVRRRSCLYAEKRFFLFEDLAEDGTVLRYVRMCDILGKYPALPFRSYDSLCTDFREFRDSVVEGIEKNSENVECIGCRNARETYYAESRKVRTYNLMTDGRCNFRCCYCDAPIHSARKTEDIFDFVRAFEMLESTGMLADDLHVDITSGEICVNPLREKMLEISGKYAETITIATNASAYNESLYKVLESKRASIIVSMDAGTKETFARIKGCDMFERVKENLRSYRKAGIGAVELKYIFVPGMNDNTEDVDGFLELCEEINPGVVTISFDFYYEGEVQSSTIEMMRRMRVGLMKGGLFHKYEARVSHIIRLTDEV